MRIRVRASPLPSLAQPQSFEHDVNSRDPQSAQSVPNAQSENCEPSPPSSHWPSLLALFAQKRPPTMQSSVHSVTLGFSTQPQLQSESQRLEEEYDQ